MAIFTDKYELSNAARNALQKIRENKELETKATIESKTPKKIDYSMYLFEEYSDEQFSNKVKTDSFIYKKFTSQLNEDQLDTAQSLLNNLLTTVKQIYEHINVEPKIYGFKNISPLKSSDVMLENEASRLMLDFFSKNYYNLTESQRKEKYGDLVVENSYQLMLTENLSIEESIDHSYKTLLVSNFIKTINFPYVIENKISELVESDVYKEMFDQENLQSLVEEFKDNNLKLSRVFALLI